MERECIKEAPTVAEAVDAALEELGVQQDDVGYEVIEEVATALCKVTNFKNIDSSLF
jgi:predicted RNA-binding protein Jag